MKKILNDNRGVAAVEFAIVLPLLLVLLFGIIEFGFFLYDQQMLTNAAREGARAGIVATSPRVTPSTIQSVVTNYFDNYAITFGDKNEVQLSPETPLGYAADAKFGDQLKVQVTYNYSFLLVPSFIPGINKVRTMTATATMRYE